MYHFAQQMQEQLPRREELSSRNHSMTPNFDNAGGPEHSSKEARSSSLLTSPDLNKWEPTSADLEELFKALEPPGTPPTPPTLLPLVEEGEQYRSGYANRLPQLQLQQQEQTEQLPQPMLQQHVRMSPNVSDSGTWPSNTTFIVPSSFKPSPTGDYVMDKPQPVPALGAAAPELDEHVTPGPHISYSGALTSNTDFIVPSSTKPSATGNYVNDKTQALPALGATPPEIDEIIKCLCAQKWPLTPSTLFSRSEEEEQYSSGYADWLPQIQRQEQEQTEQPPQPMVTQNSVTGDYVKDKTQTVPALDDTAPVWYISSDEDSNGGDSAPPTTMDQAPQQQSRCEDFISRKCTVTLDNDNARLHQHNSKQARMLQTLPRPADGHPLSPISMLDQEKTKMEEKRRRNRIAQKRCRQRQIDYNLKLQVRVRELKMDIARMESRVSHLRHERHWLWQEVSRHVTQGCQIWSHAPYDC
ncbi:uncharacterized protein LOC125759956 [Rhipicephalus sanguineus]|uniref:uncharacterized protein LOC125759956 n=1 Tax=Rhipicephalus sanguineus TaxID=34632 RepID=UPI0020C4B7E0|nr:uncharacterized protein LOC125759956 [Rhipicephalus sanguineus]